MKKLILLLPIILLYSCLEPHIEAPLIVHTVRFADNYVKHNTFKYAITFEDSDNRVDALYFTNTKYNVGDTLK